MTHKITMMDWAKLLTPKRLGKSDEEDLEKDRTSFQRDYDRIVFSSAFRRLKDKTQVYSLPKSDYIRTRLIHSHEVSCVGRSLGRIVGEEIVEKYSLEPFTAADFGDIVSAACLAHDIGNPPFGHAGEEAISAAFSSWYKKKGITSLSDPQKNDLEKYEGNALGFRILTTLEMRHRRGGMQLTCPTLAAFTKYPKESLISKEILNGYKGKSIKKYSFFQSELKLFTEVAETVGLIRRTDKAYWWARHPLSFLVEAADDICYSIVDVEDGFNMGYIPYKEAKELLTPFVNLNELPEESRSEADHIKYLRARSINTLILEAKDIFLNNDEKILKGAFDQALLDNSYKYSGYLSEISKRTRSKVFQHPDIVVVQIAGHEILEKLFAKFADSLSLQGLQGEDDKNKLNDLVHFMLPEDYKSNYMDDDYHKIMKVADYIAGMTDSYAKSLFQQFSGIAIHARL